MVFLNHSFVHSLPSRSLLLFYCKSVLCPCCITQGCVPHVQQALLLMQAMGRTGSKLVEFMLADFTQAFLVPLAQTSVK